MLNEPESETVPLVGDADEEVSSRGKRMPLSAGLPRIEVIHELPEQEQTCVSGCRTHAIGEDTSKQ